VLAAYLCGANVVFLSFGRHLQMSRFTCLLTQTTPSLPCTQCALVVDTETASVAVARHPQLRSWSESQRDLMLEI